MFQAACAASHQPAFRPTRGSGDGGVAETIGCTGAGISCGIGGGGGGGAPRPPRPPAAGAPVAGAAPAAGAAAASGGVAAAGGVLAAGGVAAGAAAGDVDGGAALVDELAHDAAPNASATATHTPALNWVRERDERIC
jgi:hypothetical protein